MILQTINKLQRREIQWLRQWMDLIYPRTCTLCNKPIVDAQTECLCHPCHEQMQPTLGGCKRCSAPLGKRNLHRKAKTKCFYCESRHWAFRRAYCYTAYVGTAGKAARKIKQATHEALAIQIGQCMANWLAAHEEFQDPIHDVCIPIPQHWFRRMKLRYNQADVLALQVARMLDIPLDKRSLYRSRWTEKQGTKSITERLFAVDHSFACRKSVSGKIVLLVDDILTSGATAHDASRALRLAGAKRVDVVAFARGVGAFERGKRNVENLAENIKLPDGLTSEVVD